MQYIVMDMEWNQPWPGSYSAKKVLPHPIRGEIIQIGAVRLLDDLSVADEFQCLVRPEYYRRMNRKVSSLTGIRDADLRDRGINFPLAMESFREWCGEDVTFLTWGFDDIPLLKDNLALWKLPDDWCSRWYNAQLLFNAALGAGNEQKALSTAMDMLRIAPTRPAHNALGDAYHTALICSRLPLQALIDDYSAALSAHENGFHGVQMPGCIARSVHRGYSDRAQVLSDMRGEKNVCPVCGEKMQLSAWLPQPGKRFLAKAQCAEHGVYYIRLRFVSEEDGLRAIRLVYEDGSETAQKYEALLQEPPRRRHHSGKKAQ